MTDIVERLLADNSYDVREAAAEEIERLREEVKYLDRLNRGTVTAGEVALRLLKKFDERDAARAALEAK